MSFSPDLIIEDVMREGGREKTINERQKATACVCDREGKGAPYFFGQRPGARVHTPPAL